MSRAGARRGVCLAVFALALACPTGAAATEASAQEVRALARAAATDPAALERLRGIDRVAGRPVPIADALRGSDGEELRARLRVLAEQGGPGGGAAGGPGARSDARDVLSQRRFKENKLPQPLRPVFEWLGDRLAPVWRWIGNAWEAIARLAPGGSGTLWALLAGALLAATALLAARAGARRQRAVAAAAGASRPAARETSAGLLRGAARAEANGDLDEALRLRFRAGLIDLDGRALIELRPALTNRELRTAVASPTLDGLVDDFESVAYGGRPAGSDDLREARDGWPRVPDEVSSR